MGGCCCSSSRTASGGAPFYYHYPQGLEVNEPLSSTHHTPYLVPVPIADPNHNTSIPSAYQPNTVLPLVDFTVAQTNAGSTENFTSKNDHRLSASVPSVENVSGNRLEDSDRCGDFIGSETISDLVNNSPKVKGELSHIACFATLVAEDDACPICLEEYDAENPRIITKCKHHFHLSCILEWFGRSNNCALCDQLMEVEDMDLFDPTLLV